MIRPGPTPHPARGTSAAPVVRNISLSVSPEFGIPPRYLGEIRRFPMLEPTEEFTLAKSWRDHGDREAAHRLVTSHLRLVAKIAMGYRGYGLPIGEVVSEGNVGLMQAVKRFDPEKGFRLATYAMWWIKAAIQEYILRSWSLVKMGTTANQKKLFFNLRKAKGRISALDEGDLRPEQVQQIATSLGVPEQDVIDMNRRLLGDTSLNAPLRKEGEGEWQDWLVDNSPSQETVLAGEEEGRTGSRLCATRSPSSTRASAASSRRGGWPTTRSPWRISPASSASPASACARSRCAPSRRFRKRSRRTSPCSSCRKSARKPPDRWPFGVRGQAPSRATCRLGARHGPDPDFRIPRTT